MSETVPTLGATVGRDVVVLLDVTTGLGLLVVVVGRLVVVVVLTVVATVTTSGAGVMNLLSRPWAHVTNEARFCNNSHSWPAEGIIKENVFFAQHSQNE